ncbi:MAG: hypothetical protein CL687_04395 [Candidatus Pelagibacter sp.]|nr:hypothetical protein [Candidatus Pelagibacter sp.]OUW23482.1 MAG: hypothetical protein CBD34_02790 [Rickettsiales bacterium TMED174]|tara:strand:+ start:536 stop:1054 length:519 start_codon:yes stop_codon:yes gene_type:complete
MKKFFFTILLSIFFSVNALRAEIIYFVDFSYVLNQSKAGKEAQEYLKKKIKTENENFSKMEKKILEDEKALIAKKNVLKNEEYKKQLTELRQRVATIQSNKRNFIASIDKKRSDSRKKLLSVLNPIMKNYMKTNNIKILVDKKNVLLGDSSLEITKQITDLLNKEIKSLNLN